MEEMFPDLGFAKPFSCGYLITEGRASFKPMILKGSLKHE